MISQTFLNLKEEKKERIIQAAKKEFSRVPIDKALVSNIIRDSNIPRGSFYQYFENIDDLFVYIIDEMYEKAIDEIGVVKENENYLDGLKDEFYHLLSILDNNENRQFNLNIYMSFVNNSYPNSKLMNEMNKLKVADGMGVPSDLKRLANSNIFLGLVEMAYITCLKDFILKGQDKEIVFSEYKNYLDYIKRSIIKTNNLG